MPKEYEVPEYNEALMCPRCGESSEVYTGMYGLFGGGQGPYTICADCGQIVSKSYDEAAKEEPIDAEFSEVKPNEAIQQRSPTDKDQATE